MGEGELRMASHEEEEEVAEGDAVDCCWGVNEDAMAHESEEGVVRSLERTAAAGVITSVEEDDERESALAS